MVTIGNLSISIITLVILGIFAFSIERKGWVSRWTVIANFVLLSGTIFPSFAGTLFEDSIFIGIQEFPAVLQYYFYGLVIAAVLTALSYFNKINLPQAFTRLIFWLYSSKSILGIMIAAMLGAFDWWFAFSLVIWGVAVYKLGHAL